GGPASEVPSYLCGVTGSKTGASPWTDGNGGRESPIAQLRLDRSRKVVEHRNRLQVVGNSALQGFEPEAGADQDPPAAGTEGRFEVVGLVTHKGSLERMRAVAAYCLAQHTTAGLQPGTFATDGADQDVVDLATDAAQPFVKGVVYGVELGLGHGAARDFRLVGADGDGIARSV